MQRLLLYVIVEIGSLSVKMGVDTMRLCNWSHKGELQKLGKGEQGKSNRIKRFNRDKPDYHLSRPSLYL